MIALISFQFKRIWARHTVESNRKAVSFSQFIKMSFDKQDFIYSFILFRYFLRFCLIYAIIGIPLTLVLLSAVVERLMTPVNWLLGALNSRLGHLYQPFNIRILHLSIVVAIVLLLFFGIPTVVFMHMEESWTALDAFYYCFISLTTIGLGDYIPGDDPDIDYRSIYKIGTVCYLILGKPNDITSTC